jgi:uncharacterized protein YceK
MGKSLITMLFAAVVSVQLSGCGTVAVLALSGVATTYQADRCAEISRQALKDGADAIETKRRHTIASCK